MERYIKLKSPNGISRKINFPNNFSRLEEQIITFFPNYNNIQYQIIDTIKKREIKDEIDFEELSYNYEQVNKKTITLNIVNKNKDLMIKKSCFNFDYIRPENENDFIVNNFKLNESRINYFNPPKLMENNILKEEKKNKKESEEDMIKSKLRSLLDENFKNIENNLLTDIKNNIKSQILLNNNNIQNINNKNESDIKNNINSSTVIHHSICCNNCGEENIKGIRYKCSVCPNFNLCSECESLDIHDDSHILIKINYPVYNEDYFSKLDKSLTYLTQGINCKLEPDFFSLRKNDLYRVCTFSIKNIGDVSWKPYFYFKCIEEKSELVGENKEIKEEILPGQCFKGEIIFQDKEYNNISYSDNNSKEYYSFYQLIDPKSNNMGNLIKFRIQLS